MWAYIFVMNTGEAGTSDCEQELVDIIQQIPH